VVHDRDESHRRATRRERNQRILRKALDLHPGEPYFPYRLACEGLCQLEGEVLPVAGLGTALGHLRTAWDKVGPLDPARRATLTWLPDLGARTASSLLAVGEVAEAAARIEETRAVFPDHPLVLLQTVAVDCARLGMARSPWSRTTRAKVLAAARRRLKQVMRAGAAGAGTHVDTRLSTLYPLRYLGELALLEGKVTEAVGLFEKALSIDPHFSFGWLGLAECSRFAGDSKRALKLYLRTVTENEGNHRAWIRGCDLMNLLEFQDNAASWWRKVVEKFPEHPAVLADGRDGRSGRPKDPEPAVQVPL
jgi:tetratricopeptide (TPR) repeat protein